MFDQYLSLDGKLIFQIVFNVIIIIRLYINDFKNKICLTFLEYLLRIRKVLIYKKTATLISQYLILTMGLLNLKYFISVTIGVTTVKQRLHVPPLPFSKSVAT